MTASIKVLPEAIINQIAAGEVIENTASVVKELIENAIDANATKIVVAIEAGGVSNILVADNGRGMTSEELLLSVQRHATSKIQSFDDLFSLTTMGFRGEALASIAAVSKMVIQSCYKEKGHALSIESGEVKDLFSFPRNAGTTVIVKSLFYNVPVRKKFQKSISANTKEIFRLINKIALTHPSITFQLEADGKKVISLNGNIQEHSYKLRVKDILGEENFNSMIPVKFEGNLFKVFGYIGLPVHARKKKSHQYLSMNKRIVVCPLISEAVKEGYGTRLGEGFFPSFVLYFSIQGKYIDVNVHPQKKEVRLRKDQYFYKDVVEAISKSFQRNESEHSLENITFSSNEEIFYEPITRNEDIRENFREFEQKELFSSSFIEHEKYDFKIHFLYSQYALIESNFLSSQFENEGLLLVDLNECYARCLFDRLHKEKSFSSQKLIAPIVIDFFLKEMAILEELIPILSQAGIDIRLIGEKTICVDSMPIFLNQMDIEAIIEIVLESFSLDEVNHKIKEKKLRQMAAAITRIAKRKTSKYSFEQISLLLRELISRDDPFLSPLGNAIVAPLTEEYIQLIFKKYGKK